MTVPAKKSDDGRKGGHAQGSTERARHALVQQKVKPKRGFERYD